MLQYIILEHTADLKIKIFGRTKEELFNNAAHGMFSQIYKNKAKVKSQITRTISIKAVDLESLLIDFLSELLSLADQYNEIYTNFNFKVLSNKSLEGKIFGGKVERFDREIKAVTYHELKIKNKNNQWIAEIVFDI